MRPPAAAGFAVLALVALASLSAWRDDAPVRPRDGDHLTDGTAWGFLALLALALGAYVAGLVLAGRLAPRVALALGVGIQLVPLAAPLLLSTDAWTTWGYGWIGANGGNPYELPPEAYPQSQAADFVGAAWRDTTSVYGPVFTLLSEPVARIAGDSPERAAWLFKALAAAGIVTALVIVARHAGAALPIVLLGWNPVLAIHLAGGGHNDALVAALVTAAVVLAATRRHALGGASWALAVLVKWIPLVLLALAALATRPRERPPLLLAAAGTAVVAGLVATWRYGLEWLGALAPLAANAAQETSYAFPSRLEQLGVPDGAALGVALAVLGGGLVLLARDALRGNARLARAGCLLLATTPYLTVWYLAWVVPLAALDEDRLARVGVVALTAYLLPQTIPLSF